MTDFEAWRKKNQEDIEKAWIEHIIWTRQNGDKEA